MSKHIPTFGHPLDVCRCGVYRCDHEQQPSKKGREKKRRAPICKRFVLERSGGWQAESHYGQA